MKVRINTDGSMEFDIDNVEDAAKAAAFARAAADTPTVVAVEPEPEKRPRQPKVEGSELNAMQYRVWEFLVENDSEKGVHIAAVARHVGIKHDNVSWWCNTLVRLGYAKRVSRGYYRPLGGAVAE